MIISTISVSLIQLYGVIRNFYTMYPPIKLPTAAAEILSPPKRTTRRKQSRKYSIYCIL